MRLVACRSSFDTMAKVQRCSIWHADVKPGADSNGPHFNFNVNKLKERFSDFPEELRKVHLLYTSVVTRTVLLLVLPPAT